MPRTPAKAGPDSNHDVTSRRTESNRTARVTRGWLMYLNECVRRRHLLTPKFGAEYYSNFDEVRRTRAGSPRITKPGRI